MKNLEKILITAQGFGFGPASKAGSIASYCRKHSPGIQIDFGGQGIAYELGLSKQNLFNNTLESNNDRIDELIESYDLLISVMEPNSVLLSKKHGEAVLDFLDDFIQLPKDAVIYDIGCATGGTLLPFIKKGYSASGLEINNEYRQYGIMRGIDIQNNESNFYETMQNADLIITSHVLEHLPRLQQILNQIRRNLKDRGLLYVEVPGILNAHKQYKHFMFALQQAHIWYFSEGTLENVLGSCGFSLVKGDEEIKAIFKKSAIKDMNTQKKHSDKIKKYLIERYLKV